MNMGVKIGTATVFALYTYNTYGQITAIDGPRSDVNDTVNFTYYPNDASTGNNRANLHTVADALGHTTAPITPSARRRPSPIQTGIITTRTFNGSGPYNATGQLHTICRVTR